MRKTLVTSCLLVLLMSCASNNQELAELNRKQARFAPAELRVDTTKLEAGDQQALAKILEAR